MNGYRDMHTAGGEKIHLEHSGILLKQEEKPLDYTTKTLPEAQDHEPQNGPILTPCFPFLSVVELHVWKCTCVYWYIICVEASGLATFFF